MTFSDFDSLKSIGKSMITLLHEFKEDFEENPISYLYEYDFNKFGLELPEKYSEEESVIQNYIRFVDEYLEILSKSGKKRIADLISCYYGLNDYKNSKGKYSHDDVAVTLGLTVSSERVRQLRYEIIKDFRSLFNGKCSEYVNIRINSKIISLLKSTINDLSNNKKVTSCLYFDDFFEKEFSYTEKISKNPQFNILLDAFNVEKGGNVESTFTDYDIYILDQDIDKSMLFSFGKIVFDTLKEEVLPISLNDLRIKILKPLKKRPKIDYVSVVVHAFPEIEIITNDLDEKYQIRFQDLPSAATKGERILYEAQKKLHIDEITNLINERLFDLGLNERVNRDAVSLFRKKKYIENVGKTGQYIFTTWESDTSNIKDVIREVFLTHKKPLQPKDVVKEVIRIRPDLPEKSIRTVNHQENIKLQNRSYILPEWKSMYKSELFKKIKNKKSNYDYVKDIIESTKDGLIPKKDLINKLVSDFSFLKPSAAAAVNNGRKAGYIKEEIINGIKIITSIKQQKIATIKKSDLILNDVISYLNKYDGQFILLSNLKKYLVNNHNHNGQNVYKQISKNDHLFESKEEGRIKYIQLKGNKMSNYGDISTNLDDFSRRILNDISHLFIKGQPKYRYTLSDALKLLIQLCKYKTKETHLEGLYEDIVITVQKLYTSKIDYHEKFKYADTLALRLEPYLKKVLFCVDKKKYYDYKSQKGTGLGKLIESLEKLDSEPHNIYAVLPKPYKFGVQIKNVYLNRNGVAHTSKNRTNKQCEQILSDTLVVYLYATLEYYNEILEEIN
jgi:hypothetical protein